MDDAQIAFDERGLAPCVVQDWSSGEVLTLAYMNEEALRLTRQTGEMHFFSRSRQELWHKGASSGNTQTVRAIRYDCDADALLALVTPAGPACHTGQRTCFHRGELDPNAPHEALPTLERTIARRSATHPQGSYTAELLADPQLIGAKVREEAEEVLARWLIAPFLLALVLGLAALRRQRRLLLICWLTVPMAAIVLLSAGKRDFNARYLMEAAPAFFVVVAAGLVAGWQTSRLRSLSGACG